MATQNQGSQTVVYRAPAFYDDAGFSLRSSISLGTISGSGGTSTQKFIAFTQLQIYGVTFYPVTALGSSTYVVNGISTTSCMSAYCVFIGNQNPAGAPIILATTIVGGASSGPFYIGGTGNPGTNVSLQGCGGLAGGYWKYAVNTLGGTNTLMPWGTATYAAGPVGAGQGLGGLYMNPGDTFYVIAGTDATGTASHALEYSLGLTSQVVG